jgi:transposase
MRYELSHDRPMLPNKPCGVPPRVDDRRTLDGIFWVLRSGAPWRGLPESYGHTPPATIASFVGAGRVSGIRSWMR